jgi:hypothetical protein
MWAAVNGGPPIDCSIGVHTSDTFVDRSIQVSEVTVDQVPAVGLD